MKKVDLLLYAVVGIGIGSVGFIIATDDGEFDEGDAMKQMALNLSLMDSSKVTCNEILNSLDSLDKEVEHSDILEKELLKKKEELKC